MNVLQWSLRLDLINLPRMFGANLSRSSLQNQQFNEHIIRIELTGQESGLEYFYFYTFKIDSVSRDIVVSICA